MTNYLPGLKAMRKRAGLTQKQLAELIGVNADTIGRYEHGKRFPRWTVIEKLAKALNCSELELLSDEESLLQTAITVITNRF